MSAFARQWDARIAPIDEPQLVPDEGSWVYESFAPTAFRGWSKREIPVLINHDPELKIGVVDCVIQHGGWHVAVFRLDRSLSGADVAAEYVKSGIGVSVGCRSFAPHRDENRLCHKICLLDEVSVLGAGVKPQYKGAEVRRSMEFPELRKPEPKSAPPESPAAVPSSDLAVAGEVIHGGPRIIRHNIGRVLAVGGQPLLRTSSGQAIRREGRDYVIDQPDGSQIMYSAEGYAEALRDGSLGVR